MNSQIFRYLMWTVSIIVHCNNSVLKDCQVVTFWKPSLTPKTHYFLLMMFRPLCVTVCIHVWM